MARMTFDDVPDLGGTIPAGTYTFRVWETNYRTSKTGNPMVEVELVVVGGDHDGRKLYDYFVTTTPHARQRLKQFVYALGIQYLDIPDEPGSMEYPARIEQIHGMELVADIALDKRDPERVVAKKYTPAGDVVAAHIAKATANVGGMDDVPF